MALTRQDVAKVGLLADHLELSNGVFVGGAVKTSTVEGQSTQTLADIYAKSILLCYVEPNPGPMQPSALKTLAWGEYSGVDVGAGQFRSWRDEDRDSEMSEIAQALDVLQPGADLVAMLVRFLQVLLHFGQTCNDAFELAFHPAKSTLETGFLLGCHAHSGHSICGRSSSSAWKTNSPLKKEAPYESRSTF
jgi:hypothetical protein